MFPCLTVQPYPCSGRCPYPAALSVLGKVSVPGIVFRNVSVFDSTALSVFRKVSVPDSVFRNVSVFDSTALSVFRKMSVPSSLISVRECVGTWHRV